MKKKQSRCRLCGLPVEWTLENPRRVCTACGEVNLPGDAAADATGTPVPTQRGPPPKNAAGTIAISFVLTALPTPSCLFAAKAFSRWSSGMNVTTNATLVYIALGGVTGLTLSGLPLYFFGSSKPKHEQGPMAIGGVLGASSLLVALPTMLMQLVFW